jgi:putative ABC transport system substrate-binding protein
LIVLDSAAFFDHRRKIAELAMKHRLPSAVNVHYFDESGFLISYGINYRNAFFRAADIAVSILKGAKPADIPIEQPTQFELAINVNTAKALGIPVPATMLARADRVIR